MWFKLLKIKNQINFNHKWGLGIGDWGLGIGDWGPIPNPQSPIPIPILLFYGLYLYYNKINILYFFLNYYNYIRVYRKLNFSIIYIKS